METSLITGANGFVGQALYRFLQDRGIKVRGAVRRMNEDLSTNPQMIAVGELNAKTDWSKALSGIDTVYHLASTVHRPDITDPAVYHETITKASLHLAKQAESMGVKRLVYVSTSHVYSASNQPLTEDAEKSPVGFYGKEKLSTEENLLEFARKTAMEVVIARPPLIYGDKVKANFKSLIYLVRRLKVLPFGRAIAKRSFVGINNMVSFLHLCAIHPKAKNSIFNVSDDQDVSVAELCQLISNILGKKIFQLPIPEFAMKVSLASMGKGDMYQKLYKPLQLDVSHAKNTLAWQPELSLIQGLENAIRGQGE